MARTRTYLAAAGETPSADSWQIWEALRELAVGRMYDDSQDAETRLIWAKLAIAAGGQRDASSGSAPARTLADEVSVRAYAVREFGAVPGDEIRDASELCETVFRGIGMSRQDVSAEAAARQELPRDGMLRLRRVKNLLTPLRSIMDTLGPDDPVRLELSAWLALIPELP
ncbi:hypothetical protein [Streptomyces sp. NBC_01601]|uniref:hypothetical protein n=1 Tax=Streptomyces sp. NBC_01601 TaxID=2975892 RepID=UPI002E2C1A20|nr:hypothetical protein [Streptomyces sp. NBC_01601]